MQFKPTIQPRCICILLYDTLVAFMPLYCKQPFYAEKSAITLCVDSWRARLAVTAASLFHYLTSVIIRFLFP